MVFEKLGKFVARHYKAIIAVWIVVFALSIPLGGKLDEKLVYNERAFLPKNMDSLKASEILAEKFPGFKAPDLIAIVDGVDARNPALKEAVLGFEDDLRDVKGVKSVTSPYDVYAQIQEKYWEKMNETYGMILAEMENNTRMLYASLWSLHGNATQLVQLVYGVPSGFLQAWIAVSEEVPAETPLSQVTEQAYTVYSAQLAGNPLAQEYLARVKEAWSMELAGYFGENATVAMLEELGPGRTHALLGELMTSAVRRVAPQFFAQALGGEAGSLAALIAERMSLASLGNETAVRELVMDVMVEKASSMGYNVSRSLLEELYNLGPSASEEELEAVARKLADTIMSDILEEHRLPPFPYGIPEELRKAMISSDLKTVVITVTLEPGLSAKESAEVAVKARELLAKHLEDKGISANHYVTGSPAFAADMKESSKNDVERIDQITVALVIVLLIVLLLSPVAPIVPLATVGVAIMTAFAALYAEAHVVDLVYMVRNFVTPLIMGVGVDYSIYMLYRFKEELENGRSVEDAVEDAVRFAGEAVSSAALTVMAGFGALAAADFKLLQSMGYSLAIVVLVAMAAALTLTPSILAWLGWRAFWPAKKSRKEGGKGGGARAGYLRKAATLATRRPWLIVGVFLVLTIASVGVLATMKRTYDFTELMPETQSIEGFKLLSEKFGSLGQASIDVIVDPGVQILYPNGTITPEAYEKIKELVGEIASTLKGEDYYITSLITVNNTVLPYKAAVNASRMAAGTLVSSDNRMTLVIVQLPYRPYAAHALDLAGKLKEALRSYSESHGIRVWLGGETMATYEMNTLVNRNFVYRITPVAVVLIVIVLYLLLRSASVALSLVAAIGTSIVWALAALVLAFQYVYGVDIYWMTPIILLTTLLGLGMDYGIFLVTRVKEELLKGRERDDAIIRAVETTGLVITACGIIMAAAFGSLMISDFKMLQEMGFAFAAAVLLDTFLVRPLFLPSVLKLLKWRPHERQA